jgi:hypothetical protein
MKELRSSVDSSSGSLSVSPASLPTTPEAMVHEAAVKQAKLVLKKIKK